MWCGQIRPACRRHRVGKVGTATRRGVVLGFVYVGECCWCHALHVECRFTRGAIRDVIRDAYDRCTLR